MEQPDAVTEVEQAIALCMFGFNAGDLYRVERIIETFGLSEPAKPYALQCCL